MTGWQDTAPCKGLSKLFFPAHNERPEAGVIREAKALAICARCPHRTPCKEIADTMHCSLSAALDTMKFGLTNLRKLMTEKEIALQ